MSNDWWGHSPEHGWVVLFRTVPPNFPGASGRLLFMRCSDRQVISEQRENWTKPQYIFSQHHLEMLNAEEAALARSELARYEGDRHELEETLLKFLTAEREAIDAERRAARQAREATRLERQREAFKKSREDFFRNLGIENPGVRPIGMKRYRRVTHCYTCKSQLDNAMDAECTACDWIVCSCGACGCGYL